MIVEIKGNSSEYNHVKELVNEAMGISKERLMEMMKLISEACMESTCESELAEKLEHILNRRELAYVAVVPLWREYRKTVFEEKVKKKVFDVICRGCINYDKCKNKF